MGPDDLAEAATGGTTPAVPVKTSRRGANEVLATLQASTSLLPTAAGIQLRDLIAETIRARSDAIFGQRLGRVMAATIAQL